MTFSTADNPLQRLATLPDAGSRTLRVDNTCSPFLHKQAGFSLNEAYGFFAKSLLICIFALPATALT